ncbi:hypothetical protein MVQ18_10965, partial [Fusobacterium necrophorum]|nr:hypothetical protein [Fusobacterium necrophorum]
AYYDSNTKNMFYCKETNSYTSANSSYFEPFDNKELLNRLNNLFKIYVGVTDFYTEIGTYAFEFPQTFNRVRNVSLEIIRS